MNKIWVTFIFVTMGVTAFSDTVSFKLTRFLDPSGFHEVSMTCVDDKPCDAVLNSLGHEAKFTLESSIGRKGIEKIAQRKISQPTNPQTKPPERALFAFEITLGQKIERGTVYYSEEYDTMAALRRSQVDTVLDLEAQILKKAAPAK